jgi:hypothetical protein
LEKLEHNLVEIIAKTRSGEYGLIDQLPMQRDWMDITFDRHAYQCFPVSLSNRLGWGISFPEDITFIWDGVNDSRSDHVKTIKGEKYTHPGRGNRTISFNTDITFHCPENDELSLLTMPVPNQFIRGAQCMSTIISPSALQGEIPIAWMITEPNIEITIPAGTPVAAIVPISTKAIQDYSLRVTKDDLDYETDDWNEMMRGRGDKSQELNKAGVWTHFYRDAINHLGESLGKHESKKIVMKVNNEL